MSPTRRIVVPSDSQSPQSWALALTYAIKLCTDFPIDFQRIVLVLHTKDVLKHSMLTSAIGKAAANALLGGNAVPTGHGPALSLTTERKLPMSLNGAVAIAYFADDGLLECLDGVAGLKGVVAVPDFENSANRWIDRWTPTIHGLPAQAEKNLISDPVVEQALRSVTRSINLGNGVLNSRDKEYVDHTVRILRAKGHKADAEDVKSWAIKNGWKPGAADDLARLSSKIFKLTSKPNLNKIYDPESRYARWVAGEE